MQLPLVQVDAFSDRLFGGNPAAVVLLEEWLPEAVMQAIAAENNLSETAFVIPRPDVSPLRWFTPKVEVDLCGHATLATAHVLLEHCFPTQSRIAFSTRSGELYVSREGELLSLDFPARPAQRVEVSEALVAALGRRPLEVWQATALMAVFESEAEVRALAPDMAKLAVLSAEDIMGVIVTAPGDPVDFVSRFFAPAKGIPEDPVTGSAHCTLIPYWAERLGKDQLHARQISARGGELFCELRCERVSIAGRAVEYLRGEITVPD